MRTITVLDAPSNLGLRPPERGSVPGVYKLGGALRDNGILGRLGARDGGVVVAPRYRAEWDGRTVRNADAIALYSRKLAGRVGDILGRGEFALVLGGDCSILIGTLLAAHRHDRVGLIFIDAHSDFRHLGNSDHVGSAAGEDLAIVSGRGAAELADIEGLGPLVLDADVCLIGVRAHDEALAEVETLGMTVATSARVASQGAANVAREALSIFEQRGVERFWIHLDVDVLDALVFPAVDTPEPDGLDFAQLVELVRTLTSSEQALGLDLTVFDPDLDPDGELASQLTEALVAVLGDNPCTTTQGALPIQET